jgi:hypothetical protein
MKYEFRDYILEMSKPQQPFGTEYVVGHVNVLSTGQKLKG